MLFDTHAHLDDDALFPQVEQVLARAKTAGVGFINSVGCSLSSSRRNVELAHKYPDVYAIVGVHPSESQDMNEDAMAQLLALAKQPKVVAWGEIGLDYHYEDDTPHELQQEYFRRQIILAKEAGKPIVIHDRDANQDVMDILREMRAGENGGILHCFSGSWEMAKFCLELGFMISFAGPLTYKNARVPVEVAAKVPLDMILVETDSPYLTPQPFRGHTNEPSFVKYTAAKMAEIRGMDPERIAEITAANARRVFGL